MTDAATDVRRGHGSAAHIPRRALLSLLTPQAARPVTVVSAPAGSGKTMLLRSWAQQQGAPVAWATVGRNDFDAQRFWNSVVKALRTAATAAIGAFTPSPGFDGDTLVERLTAELASLERLAGELTEVRAADLRFSVDEARELLTTAGVELPETNLALLCDRTEGWAAGLRLAAIARPPNRIPNGTWPSSRAASEPSPTTYSRRS